MGCGGEEEILDLRMMQSLPNTEIFEKLAAVMPNGIEILRVYEQKGKLSDIKWAINVIDYSGVAADDKLCADIEEMFKSPVIMMKRSKSGEKETDISTLIKWVKAEVHPEGQDVLRRPRVHSRERTLWVEAGKASSQKWKFTRGPSEPCGVPPFWQ